MADSYRIAVLLSGAGTNLQALIDQVHGRGIEIAAVAASRVDAGGLERAKRAGLETGVFAVGDYAERERHDAGGSHAERERRDVAGSHAERERRDAALADWLDEHAVELVVLAGWMELLGPAFVRRFAGRIINVHPSLLPAFPGLGAIEQAVAQGAKTTGVTVHFVDERMDSGAIVLQEALELSYPAPIGEIEERVHGVEHRLLPRAVRLFAEGRVRLDPANPRVVLIDDVD